jgi:hypothetical protein
MPNRRDIKKDINSVLGDVLEECYSEMLHHPEKNDAAINAIVDDAVDLADDLIARVNASKKLKSGKEMKTSFQTIADELQDKAIGFIEKLNSLS